MEIIPVLDLRHGQAVMAVRGQRDHYRPLRTPLSADSEPLAVVSALLGLHPFRVLYIADLDCLLRTGDNGITIARIQRAFPRLRLWIDRGWPPVEPAARITPVVGSESLGTDWRPALAGLKPPWILSLDFDARGFCGPAGLLAEPDRWPASVILMTLARVGSQSGPDWLRLDTFGRRHPHVRWIAAGGIRGPHDLNRLQALGITRALVASALHYGHIRP